MMLQTSHMAVAVTAALCDAELAAKRGTGSTSEGCSCCLELALTDTRKFNALRNSTQTLSETAGTSVTWNSAAESNDMRVRHARAQCMSMSVPHARDSLRRLTATSQWWARAGLRMAREHMSLGSCRRLRRKGGVRRGDGAEAGYECQGAAMLVCGAERQAPA